MRKPKYRALSERQTTELILRLRKSGRSWGQVAAELGVSRQVAMRWGHRNPADYPPDVAVEPPPLPNTSEGFPVDERTPMGAELNVSDIEERVRMKDTVGRLGGEVTALTQLVKGMDEKLSALTRQPIRVETHDDRADVSCPTCGTHAVVPIGLANPEHFDDVLKQFDKSHVRSPTGRVMDCPDCRPKVDAKLKEMGYALQKIQPPRK